MIWEKENWGVVMNRKKVQELANYICFLFLMRIK